MSYFCKICYGTCFGTHIPADICFHEMKRIRWFRSETQCKKCLFQLPKGMTWVPVLTQELIERDN